MVNFNDPGEASKVVVWIKNQAEFLARLEKMCIRDSQYAALLDRAADLEIPLEDLLLQAIQHQVKAREYPA